MARVPVVICPTCNPKAFGLNNGPIPAGFKYKKKKYVTRAGKSMTVQYLDDCPDCGGFGIISDDGQPPV